MRWEVLDPRHDAEPAYWAALRARAGLRADWAWEVLSAQAWCGRTPLLVSVLRDGGGGDVEGADGVEGVVCAGWAGLPVRRHGFVGAGRGRLLGGLHVRSPGTGSVPGWWTARLSTVELVRNYVRGMRRELGLGCRGALLRQLTGVEAAAVGGWLRQTESLAVLPTARWGSAQDWRASLKRKRRHNLKQIARAIAAEPAVEVEVVPAATLDPCEVAAVLRHNERKYRGPVAPLPQTTGYLAALLRQQDVLAGCYRRRSGELLALVTILDHPRWPVTRHWSALPAVRAEWPELNLYLDHYAMVVEWAIGAGREGVVVGRGKPELKRSLGADLVPQFAAAVR